MGLGGLVKKGFGAAGTLAAVGAAAPKIAQATAEATRLTRASTVERTARIARGVLGTEAGASSAALAAARAGTELIQMPGVAAGDRFVLGDQSVLAGLRNITGSAVVRHIDAHSVTFDMDVRLGPLAQKSSVRLAALDADTAELVVEGVAPAPHRLLANVEHSSPGELRLSPVGGRPGDGVHIVQRGDETVMSMPFAGLDNRLVLHPA